ncbi:hypothetical protein ACFFQF_17915 [Haladaptatus pallidirubidus]|uniref:hypothetical protein n=1 Tax=Haladaptatus pallidirubidus TaxID=1008152 RepID=UPI0035E9C7EE
MMTVLGTWRVWERPAAACDSHGHRGRHEAHFLLPYNHPIEEHLARLVEPNDSALVPDGGWVPGRETQSAIQPETNTVSAEPSADELSSSLQHSQKRRWRRHSPKRVGSISSLIGR